MNPTVALSSTSQDREYGRATEGLCEIDRSDLSSCFDDDRFVDIEDSLEAKKIFGLLVGLDFFRASKRMLSNTQEIVLKTPIVSSRCSVLTSFRALALGKENSASLDRKE